MAVNRNSRRASGTNRRGERKSRRTERRTESKAARSARKAARSARRTERRTERKAARSARRTERRTERRNTKKTGRKKPVVGRSIKATRAERVDAVSNILAAAAGVKRRSPPKKVGKPRVKEDVKSYLAGIETSGSYGLKEIFKNDEKNYKTPKRGPMRPDSTGPLDPANIKGNVVREETTGPLDPANIKGNVVKVKHGKDTKAKTIRKGVKQTGWIEHVKEFYNEKKKTNPNYKYSQALKDAKGTYKK